MNYFPYIALGLVALLGYWYINGLTNSIRELESRNATLQAEVKVTSDMMQDMRRQYSEIHRTLRQYNASINSMQTSVTTLSTKLVKNEKRLNTLAQEHPILMQNAVNKAVAERMACLVAASRGERVAKVGDDEIKCD